MQVLSEKQNKTKQNKTKKQITQKELSSGIAVKILSVVSLSKISEAENLLLIVIFTSKGTNKLVREKYQFQPWLMLSK